MNEEHIISKITKLLAVANDLRGNEQERETALRQAYAMMAKHNIDMATVEKGGGKVDEARVDFPKVSWSWLWARQVNATIADLFFCKYYYYEKINGTQITHHFVGRESNAMTAAVMADFVVNSILKEGRAIYKSNTSAPMRSFAVGASSALRGRVAQIIADKQQEFDATPGTAIVLASLYDQESVENDKIMPPGLRVVKSRVSRVESDAYAAGRAFGNKINLDLQVSEESRKLGRN